MLFKIIFGVVFGIIVLATIIYGLTPKGDVGAMDEMNRQHIEDLKQRDMDRCRPDKGDE